MAQLTQFYRDLEAAKPAEHIVYNYLLTSGYDVEDVSDIREYYNKGDIKLVLPTGKTFYIDVKDDSRIAETRNVLCEEDVYFKDNDYFSPGDMKKSYDILAVVSKSENKIYFIDFHTLKQNYRKGEFKLIKHYQQDTYAYLVHLAHIKR